MKYTIIGVAVIVVIGLVIWRLWSSSETAQREALPPDLDPTKLLLATQAQSDERAARLLPTKGSEDASHLLVRPKPQASSERDVGPNDSIEWVVDVSSAQAG